MPAGEGCRGGPPDDSRLISSDDLNQLQVQDRPGVKINSPLERASKAMPVEGDDPAFLDDEIFDDAVAGQGGAADRSIFALGGTVERREISAILRGGLLQDGFLAGCGSAWVVI
jgi:hypothetical protein